LCCQSVGLIVRLLKQDGIATTLTSVLPGMTRPIAPPRSTDTGLATGRVVGAPGDRPQQRRVLEATLALLAHGAPLPAVKLDETCE
jgi:hypothetical protein